jgi:glycosyltransferase involved in cell wall biosynthesis
MTRKGSAAPTHGTVAQVRSKYKVSNKVTYKYDDPIDSNKTGQWSILDLFSGDKKNVNDDYGKKTIKLRNNKKLPSNNKNIVMNSSDNATNIINISTSDNGTSDVSDKTEEETEIIEEVTENEITEEVSETNEEIGVLIVMDRPTENQRKRIFQLGKNIRNFRAIDSLGGGIGAALNTGLDFSKAEFIRRLDSDDEVIYGSLFQQIRFLEINSEYACVGGQMNFINESGRVIGLTRYPNSHSQIAERLKYQNCLGHPATLFNRQKVISIGGYRPAMSGAEDYDLWLRLTKHHKVANLEMLVTNYRISDQQYSRSLGNRQLLIENLARADSVLSKLKQKPAALPVNFTNDEQIAKKIKEIENDVKKSSILLYIRLQSAKKINAAMRLSRSNSGTLIRRTKQALLLLEASILSPIFIWKFFLGFFKFRNIRYE